MSSPRVCLDARTGTPGGTTTFMENFLGELDARCKSENNAPHLALIVHHDAEYHYAHLPIVARVPSPRRWREFYWSQTALPRILRSEHFDAYHSLKHVGPIWCPTRSLYRVPAVGQFADNYPMERFDKIYWTAMARQVYRRADLLVAVSDYIRHGLIEHLRIPAERIVTIHNGVDTCYRPLDTDQPLGPLRSQWQIDRPYVLSVGNVVPVKNLTTALRAMGWIKEMMSDPPLLVIAGGTRYRHYDELVQLGDDLGITPLLRFIGFQPREQLVRWYNGAELLLHPSLHEGFSFTVLEGLACGTPLVTTTSTSIPEAAGDAAYYYGTPQDADALAEAIRILLDDTARRQQLGQAGIRQAQRFTWQQCVAQTLDAYARILA